MRSAAPRFLPGFFIMVLVSFAPSGSACAASESMLWNLGGGSDGSNSYGGLIADASGNLYGTTFGGGTYGADFTTGQGGTAFKLTRPTTRGGSWTESVLWNFGNVSDGQSPAAGLIMDAHGNLYGTTQIGGANHAGTVFELMPPATRAGSWTEQILWSFGTGGDGAFPDAGLIMDETGTLYGTTESGGAFTNPNGTGTVFKLTPPASSGGAWTESILWSFGNGTDGALPEASLLRDANGDLYGTTIAGGAKGAGTVFKLTPPTTAGNWSELILWSFGNGADGSFPRTSLIMDWRRNLYGSTTSGGAHGNGQFGVGGTVFRLTRDGVEAVLWSFGSAADGQVPEGGLIRDERGSLYGTTSAGGANRGGSDPVNGAGTVFMLTRDGSESILWNFGSGVDGQAPSGALLMDRGNVYGTTTYGGTFLGAGTSSGGGVFEISATRPCDRTGCFPAAP